MSDSIEVTVTEANKEELEKLRAFYNAVARLTSHHDHVECEHYHHAVVFPRDLGEELAKVDPEWWKLDKEEWNRLNEAHGTD